MTPESNRIKIGISACLLGQQVRYDGGHKHDRYLCEHLGKFFEYVPICPEVAIGLSTPREPIRLVRQGDKVLALGVRNAELNVTEALEGFGRKMALTHADVSGYVFKKSSPSCGLFRVKVYDGETMPQAVGQGIYARTFIQCQPLLPVEEEGRLQNRLIRDNFIERVLIYNRWQSLMRQGITPRGLVEFHTAHKYAILTRGQQSYRDLGRIVAQAGQGDITELAARYIQLLMSMLTIIASRGAQANVLMHIMGYLKRNLAAEDKKEMLHLITEYRTGKLPINVPLTMLRHYLRHVPNAYLAGQHYLYNRADDLHLRDEPGF